MRFSTEFFEDHPGPPADRRTIAVLVSSVLLLIAFYYFCGRGAFYSFGGAGWVRSLLPGATEETVDFASYVYWSAGAIVFRVLIPILIITQLLRDRLSEYGFAPNFSLQSMRVYGLLFLIMAPLLFAASLSPEFRETYPFYKPALASLGAFVAFEAVYALQFIGVEAFFRGFLTFGLFRSFGYYAALVATIPYVMIHFGKPLAESLGAAIAGLALSMLALKTRSIWPGVLLHWAVAATMDAFALLQFNGGLGALFR
ncbi:MAG: hypothetical protein Tsb0010_11740 [Parvularculaceae bacterium]